jgi:peptidyl-tRNA hydrolase, PTH1 family
MREGFFITQVFMTIKLIVGLGNPGKEYESTRHNAGFWFVDEIAKRLGADVQRDAKFFGIVGKAHVAGSPIWLLKPTTFMNRSGQAVAALANFYQILPEEILVAHDELDLMPGQTKMKKAGGHAGHNGLRDIQAKMGSPDFWRLRLGIGHPRTLELQQQVADFVLHQPSKCDRKLIDADIDRAADVMPECVAGQFEVAMMRLHTSNS